MKSLIQQFLDFCRSKPADEVYDYGDTEGCAGFQFLKAEGYPVKSVGGSYWRDTNDAKHPWPGGQDGFAFGYIISRHPNTFGALASRLETLP